MAEEPTPVMPGDLHESTGQERDTELSKEQEADKALVQEVVDHIADVSSIENLQRIQEEDDLNFEGVDQWTPEARDSRAEHVDEVTESKIAARPAITANLVEQPVQRVLAEARQSRLAISVQPKAGLSNTAQAGYFKGLIRSIQVESGATEVRMWALEFAAKCGRHAYEIDTEYANDGDFDVDIIYRRILDQSSVYWDPYSVMADRRDADKFAIGEWISEDTRKRRWPKKPLIAPAGAFQTANDPWFAMDQGKKSCFIVRYFKVVFTDEVLGYHPSIGPMKLDKMPPDIQMLVKAKAPETRMRTIPVRSVRKYVVDGSQVLEEHAWDGRYIPAIPVTGKEYNVKGKRSWKGIVTNAKELNRAYNVAISSAVEAAGSIPRAPYIMYAGQDAGFEEMWDDSPIKAYTRLYVNMVELGGKPAPLPRRENLEPALQGMLLLARSLKDDISSVTGQVDPAMRAVNPYDRSGKAIEALQRQGAAGTSSFLDNLATISMPQEGRVLVDLIPKVYDRPGRILTVMGEEHDDETAIMLKVPFVRDKDGNPVAVPCQACKGKGAIAGPRTMRHPIAPPAVTCPVCQGTKQATKQNMPPEWQGQKVDYVDLAEGQFKVSVAIGRNYQTKQEEAMTAMTELSKAAPDLVPVYADLWVRAMGFSGSTEIADRIKRHNPAAQSDEKDKQIPPEIAAKMQQLQAEHQAAMEALKQAQQAIETDAVKMAGQKEMLAMKLEAAEGLENLKQQSQLMQATSDERTSTALEQVKGQIKEMLQESEQRHEVLMELIQQRRLTMDADRQAEAEAEQSLRDNTHQFVHDEAGRQHEREQAERDRQTQLLDSEADRQATRSDSDADREHQTNTAAADREHQRQDSEAQRQFDREQAQAAADAAQAEGGETE